MVFSPCTKQLILAWRWCQTPQSSQAAPLCSHSLPSGANRKPSSSPVSQNVWLWIRGPHRLRFGSFARVAHRTQRNIDLHLAVSERDFRKETDEQPGELYTGYGWPEGVSMPFLGMSACVHQHRSSLNLALLGFHGGFMTQA